MSGGLRNEDFRRLLATPRPGAGGGGGGGGEGGEKKKGGKKPGRNYKPGGKAKEGEDKEEGPSYRDRAAERRKGFSTDFEGVPDDLVGLLEGKGDLRGQLSYEDSKYLGGDVAHTHLVKGLDFALLQKVRSEQEAAKRSGGGACEGGPGDEQRPVLAKKVEVPGLAPQAPAVFKTPLGSSVYAFFFDPSQRTLGGGPVADLFLPRRTAFVYELDEPSAPDVPTMLRRSKEDCPKVAETAMGGLDGGVLDRIAKIMSYMTVAGGGRKKLKKKEREALLTQHGIAVTGALKAGGGGGGAAPPSGPPADGGGEDGGGPEAAPRRPVDEDDDIFGDAGTDYVPTVKDAERAQRAAAAAAEAAEQQRRGGYFGAGGAEDLHADLPPLPKDDVAAPPLPGEEGELIGPSAGPSRPPAGYDTGAAFGAYPEAETYDPAAEAAAAAEAVRKEKAREKRRAEMLAGVDDAYAECYPSYYDQGIQVADSDEEGAAPQEQDKALTRRDFASEADWEEYQASGQAPRQVEGRAKVRAQQKEASKEKGKVATQLSKIQAIMEEKGYDHTAAFTRPDRKAKGGGGGEGGGDDAPVPFTKKRRI